MPAKPFVGTYDTIEQIAETFRSRFGIKPEEKLGGSSRLLELVSKTGGKVGILNQPAAYEADGGSLVIRGPNQYTIFLSPYTTPLRDNFTIAHELGHFVLHYVLRRTELEGELPLRFARYGTGEMEWQANRFAAALLMPKAAFEADFIKLGRDVVLLAGRYGVSGSAAENRCKSLKLLPNN